MCHNLNLICQGVFNGKKLKQLANSSYNQIDVEDIINELTSESESESEPQDDSADESINNDYSLLVDVINDDDDSFSNSSDLEIFEQLDDVGIEVAGLILKIRKLVKMVKNVSSISREFSKLIDENEETICTNLILDFHVRWNSTYLMLKRLKRFQDCVNRLIANSSSINGITVAQVNNLDI